MASGESWNTGMAALFERARREGLWFRSAYHDLWFSPAELAKAQSEGRFRWGAVNWELRDPREQMEYLKRRAREAANEAVRFEKKAGG